MNGNLLQDRLQKNKVISENNSTKDFLVENYDQIKEKVKNDINEKYGQKILTDRTESFKKDLKDSIDFSIKSMNINCEIAKLQLLSKKIFDFIVGLGPLQKLLSDDSITEIMVSRYDKIYVEQHGKLQLLTDITFENEDELRMIIDKIVAPINRTINESQPIVDARLSDGSRVHAIVPPIAVDGSLLTIRKFSKKKLTGEDYLRFGSLNEKMLEFLETAVKFKANIIVSGGTGTGKTTLLNMLSNFVPSFESLITVEDSCELILCQDNVRRLEARPANSEGTGEVSIRDLVKATLRMRPDRIIVGEIRDGVIVDMFRALSSGHDGGLSTIHSNSPLDLVNTAMPILFGMSDMAFTEKSRNLLISSSLDLIVQITRFSDGSRKITKITHVVGVGKKAARKAGYSKEELEDIEDIDIILKDIFIFKQQGKDSNGKVLGNYCTTGYIPKELLSKFELEGKIIPYSFFKKEFKEDTEYMSKKCDKMGANMDTIIKNAPKVKYEDIKEKKITKTNKVNNIPTLNKKNEKENIQVEKIKNNCISNEPSLNINDINTNSPIENINAFNDFEIPNVDLSISQVDLGNTNNFNINTNTIGSSNIDETPQVDLGIGISNNSFSDNLNLNISNDFDISKVDLCTNNNPLNNDLNNINTQFINIEDDNNNKGNNVETKFEF